jgi:hypothetical protein
MNKSLKPLPLLVTMAAVLVLNATAQQPKPMRNGRTSPYWKVVLRSAWF